MENKFILIKTDRNKHSIIDLFDYYAQSIAALSNEIKKCKKDNYEMKYNNTLVAYLEKDTDDFIVYQIRETKDWETILCK